MFYLQLKDQEQKYGIKLDELKKTAVALGICYFKQKLKGFIQKKITDESLKNIKMKRRKQKKRGRGTMNALERRRKSKGRRFYKISNLIKMKTALEEEKGNHRLSNIKHKALLDEINNTMKEMDKLEKDVENKDKDKDLKNSMKKEEEKSLGYVKLEQKQMEDIKKSLLTRQEKIKENIDDIVW